jgi:hypothetical protein
MTLEKITSVFGKQADSIYEILDGGGTLTYRVKSIEGRTVLEIYIEK